MSQASTVELQMLALINAERASHGLAPLRINNRLNAAAEGHSKWMLEADVFSHTGAAGSTADQRMRAAGYTFEGNWANGENIGWQSLRGPDGISDDVVNLHQGLMNSPPHRANILNPNFTEIGIGVETGDFLVSGRNWPAAFVTQNFGRSSADNSGPVTPPPTPPSGPPAINGTEGADALTGGAMGETMAGRGGHDRLSGLGGNDSIAGGFGNDSLYGGDGDDRLDGEAEADHLDGGEGNDKLLGGDGNDAMFGGSGVDRLDGGAGNDSLYGGDGDDRLVAGEGADTLEGGLGQDNLYGGAGNDRIWGGTGADSLSGEAGDDHLDGGDGADFLWGSDGQDRLWGDLGNDSLKGGAGNDTLGGGSGNDQLDGGAGNDVLTGWADADVFLFQRGGGRDQVVDFTDNIDTLAFGSSLWGQAASAQAFVTAYARIGNGAAVFDFGNGDVLTVTGLSALSQLYDDVMLFA